MRIGRRDTSRRLTGLTLPSVLGTGGGGLTWANDQTEIAMARSALQQLENRRVLYDPLEFDEPGACVASVQEIRSDLTSRIDQSTSAELRDPLRAIQAACRQFLTDVQRIDMNYEIDIWGGSHKSWLFNQALGTLRARVGTCIAIIINTFDIDVDEHLEKILPPPID